MLEQYKQEVRKYLTWCYNLKVSYGWNPASKLEFDQFELSPRDYLILLEKNAYLKGMEALLNLNNIDIKKIYAEVELSGGW